MANKIGFLWKYVANNEQHAVVIDDDGKCCYAYYSVDDIYQTDVWLYNRETTPENPEWEEKDGRPPFKNGKEYCSSIPFEPIQNPKDIRIVWQYDSNDFPMLIFIYVRGDLFAIIDPKKRPGWCKLAVKAGPLAIPLKEYFH